MPSAAISVISIFSYDAFFYVFVIQSAAASAGGKTRGSDDSFTASPCQASSGLLAIGLPCCWQSWQSSTAR